MSDSRWVWALAILSVSVGHATVRAEPVDPDTLVVPEPKTSPKRIAADEINQLLRTELSILEGVQELDMNMARRTAELERLDVQEKTVETDLLETTDDAGGDARARRALGVADVVINATL